MAGSDRIPRPWKVYRELWHNCTVGRGLLGLIRQAQLRSIWSTWEEGLGPWSWSWRWPWPWPVTTDDFHMVDMCLQTALRTSQTPCHAVQFSDPPYTVHSAPIIHKMLNTILSTHKRWKTVFCTHQKWNIVRSHPQLVEYFFLPSSLVGILFFPSAIGGVPFLLPTK
jgi:hypothetical protein